MDRHLGTILKISGFKMFLEDNSYLGGSTHCTPPPHPSHGNDCDGRVFVNLIRNSYY